ncbi:NADH-quinone oxidoreductase subunit L [Rhodanobacter sp. 115]|uniref:NADH-quinone oxidoreductase subunit L n=1 Tax=Rhodanobacter sp. FW021-MT20 TaxID=1162282 RepID=UPI000260F84D|nr:NADH-quinone oxidoreductase subunit L [Rhodanobacter sp. 115]EIM00100.1 NADH dehydrogenase subunit L [Rhodanobacter sp. 115]
MDLLLAINHAVALLPALLMLGAAWTPRVFRTSTIARWQGFNRLAVLALVFAAISLGLELIVARMPGHPAFGGGHAWFAPNLFGCWVSLLVQFLGTVIGVYSMRHLRGEHRQGTYIASLAVVLASVHFLLLANHWVTLIGAWMAIGFGMQRLLTFYPERGFAQLAAHKKRIADRLADLLLIVAAVLAWRTVGSGSLSVLMAQVAAGVRAPELSASATLLALAVILRTALLPVHGWLIQVMEAPTPVSALLHAGVVNLGGYVLVFFAPLLGVSDVAHWCLVVIGLVSTVLGGTVMITRVSLKVHLAWSTLSQMGFMLMECGLGLYQLAALPSAGALAVQGTFVPGGIVGGTQHAHPAVARRRPQRASEPAVGTTVGVRRGLVRAASAGRPGLAVVVERDPGAGMGAVAVVAGASAEMARLDRPGDGGGLHGGGLRGGVPAAGRGFRAVRGRRAAGVRRHGLHVCRLRGAAVVAAGLRRLAPVDLRGLLSGRVVHRTGAALVAATRGGVGGQSVPYHAVRAGKG